jgi:1,2-diacylglycerol 3-alpha-glucosyltransferase
VKVLEATDFYYPWIAGPAPFIRNLSIGLVNRGHEVVIACPSPSGRPFDENGPPRTHRVRTWPVPFGYRLRAGIPMGDMNRFVARWRPDIVHLHHPFPISAAAMIAARRHKIPVVATNHTIPECTLFGLRNSPLYKPAQAAFSAYINGFLKRAEVVTTPTESAAGMLRSMGFTGFVRAISNGVDTGRFRPAEADDDRPGGADADKENEPPVVLYTGRLDDDKDMDTFVDAIPHVLEAIPARFRIGGEGTDRARLETRVRAMGLSDAVEFTGYVPDAGLPAVFRGASLYAISSRVELQSISTLEAMASGLPVVAVDACALPELVRLGENGILVPSGDGPAFGRAIVAILQDNGLCKRMGRASRRIAEGHSVDEMVSRYEQVFRGLMREPRREAVCDAVHA